MRQQAAEKVNLVRHQTARWNISHLRLVLQLPINLLLIAPALVEARHFARGRCLVGHNHLELMALLHRLQHPQQMAGHESPRTTKLYDRTKDEITLSEVERIRL